MSEITHRGRSDGLTVRRERQVRLINRVYEPPAGLSSLALTILKCRRYVDEPVPGNGDRRRQNIATIGPGPAATTRLGKSRRRRL